MERKLSLKVGSWQYADDSLPFKVKTGVLCVHFQKTATGPSYGMLAVVVGAFERMGIEILSISSAENRLAVVANLSRAEIEKLRVALHGRVKVGTALHAAAFSVKGMTEKNGQAVMDAVKNVSLLAVSADGNGNLVLVVREAEAGKCSRALTAALQGAKPVEA